ncbi:MAG: NAD(P)(+) transhydrogenase (Re/Si-specific) subunit alpha, partial [Planctomycetota bacterium]
MPLIIGVPKENCAGERRVAIVPSAVKSLARLGAELVVESGAGTEAGFPDELYTQAGARISNDRDEIFRDAEVI